METLNEQRRQQNFELFKKKLQGLGVNTEDLERFFGKDLTNGTYSLANKDNTVCGDGHLLNTILRTLTPIALNLNKLLPEEKQANTESLLKTCLLHQISKCTMMIPNDNKWEIETRGMLYKFNNDYPYALKMGMRSLAMCINCGITLTENEIEAIANLDRDDDKQVKFHSSPLSIVLRQAIELTDIATRI